MKKPKKKWRPVFDNLITSMLTGKTQRAAAAECGIHEQYLSKLMQWPPFLREYRRRRALIVEESDAWIQAATQTAVERLFEILNMNRHKVLTYTDSKGRERKVTVKPNFHLVQTTAVEILRAGRERADKDVIVQRIDELKQKAKKSLKE